VKAAVAEAVAAARTEAEAEAARAVEAARAEARKAGAEEAAGTLVDLMYLGSVSGLARVSTRLVACSVCGSLVAAWPRIALWSSRWWHQPGSRADHAW
jgi:septal ring factor EnvC (AmiA/AmiB activator)